MSDIINLDDHRPHEARYVACMKCAHDWVAVFPVKATALECSKCGEMSGEPVAYTDVEWFCRFIDFEMSSEEQRKRSLVLLNAKRMAP
jgi:hypothetical protein